MVRLFERNHAFRLDLRQRALVGQRRRRGTSLLRSTVRCLCGQTVLLFDSRQKPKPQKDSIDIKCGHTPGLWPPLDCHVHQSGPNLVVLVLSACLSGQLRPRSGHFAQRLPRDERGDRTEEELRRIPRLGNHWMGRDRLVATLTDHCPTDHSLTGVVAGVVNNYITQLPYLLPGLLMFIVIEGVDIVCMIFKLKLISIAGSESNSVTAETLIPKV